MCDPKGVVFDPFWSEIGYTFNHFGSSLKLQKRVWILEPRSESGYEFQRTDLNKGTEKLHILD